MLSWDNNFLLSELVFALTMTSKNCTHSKSTIYILLIAEKKMYFLNFLPYDRTVLAVQFCKKNANCLAWQISWGCVCIWLLSTNNRIVDEKSANQKAILSKNVFGLNLVMGQSMNFDFLKLDKWVLVKFMDICV